MRFHSALAMYRGVMGIVRNTRTITFDANAQMLVSLQYFPETLVNT